MPETSAGESESAAGGGRMRRGIWLMVTAICLLGLTGVNVYRAATQSVTHDEAMTYERYVAGPAYRLISSTDANNHILHSVLCRVTVGVAGPSELALRLPSLAGGVLFLTMLARIGWRVWGPSPIPALIVLLLGLNPFVMDYLSIARGYSLAFGLWTAALERLMAASETLEQRDLHLRRASQLLGLSVLANLTFAPAALALAAGWAWLAWPLRRREIVETARQSMRWLWQALGRPGVIVFACLALPLVKIRPWHFYYGAATLQQSLLSVVNASFAHHPQRWPWDNQSEWFGRATELIAVWIVPAVVIALCMAGGIAARALRRRMANPTGRVAPGELLFYLSATSLGLVIAMLSFLHVVIGMKWPIERTGIHLLPPLFLAMLSATVFLPRLLRTAVMLISVLLCTVWAFQFQTDHYRSWANERDSRTVFQQLVSGYDRNSKQRLRVGAYWGMVPALNFYRDRYKADFVERIERGQRYPDDCDLYVIPAGGIAPKEPIVELYRGPASGTVVAVRQNGGSGRSGGGEGRPMRP